MKYHDPIANIVIDAPSEVTQEELVFAARYRAFKVVSLLISETHLAEQLLSEADPTLTSFTTFLSTVVQANMQKIGTYTGQIIALERLEPVAEPSLIDLTGKMS